MTTRAEHGNSIRVNENTQFVVSWGIMVAIVCAAVWIAVQLTSINYSIQDVRKDINSLTKVVEEHSQILQARPR